jgi:hypothetical protein
VEPQPATGRLDYSLGSGRSRSSLIVASKSKKNRVRPWIVRLRSSGGVKVVDFIETHLNATRGQPLRRVAPACLLMLGAFLAWSPEGCA